MLLMVGSELMRYSRRTLKFFVVLFKLLVTNRQGFRIAIDVFFSFADYLTSERFNSLVRDWLKRRDIIDTHNVHWQLGKYQEASDDYLRLASTLKSEKLDDVASKFRFIGNEISGSIGHLTLGLSQRLMAKKLGHDNNNYLVLSSRFANKHFINEYWGKLLPIWSITEFESKVIELSQPRLLETISLTSYDQQYITLEDASTKIYSEWEELSLPPLLSLTPEDELAGQNFLDSFNIKSSDWFVTLHVRHNGQGSSHPRNENIESYFEAIRYINSLGAWVFRIGESEGIAPDPVACPRYLDYGNSQFRTEQLDIFLMSKCRFMVGCSSGPIQVPITFGTPVLWTNYSEIGMVQYFPKTVMIPKLRLKKNHADSDFWADLEEGVYDGESIPLRFKDKFTTVPNDSEDILNGIKTMIEVENSGWDFGLRSRQFSEIMQRRKSLKSPMIPEYFLEKHQEYFVLPE